jgi:hypothetical protein
VEHLFRYGLRETQIESIASVTDARWRKIWTAHPNKIIAAVKRRRQALDSIH